ncbi:MAG: hypothetical protein QHH24_00360 [Candidatus Bathyarchaeota archaeon]|nr:hypothetical protein [Candidatus Bathyarchaeota archaeon]
MATTLQRKVPGAFTSATPQMRKLTAESVTIIATAFLKSIGNKGSLKPKRVSLEEGVYIVEVEMKRLAAVVRVDSETHEIKEYEIQSKGEEASLVSISPKFLLVTFGISAVVHVALYFALKMLGF